MKKYFEPKMSIQAFEMGNILALSGLNPNPEKPALVDGLEDVAGSTVNLSLKDILTTM